MTLWSQYYLPHTLKELFEILQVASQPYSLVAGGTDLLLDLQQGRHPPLQALVDVTTVVELQYFGFMDGRLYIGAGVPLSQVVEHPLVIEHAWALHQAAGLIGGPQVRNSATLGGNVAHGLPAADGSIALLALGAEAEVASCQAAPSAVEIARRLVPLQELYLGPGKTALQPGEVLLGFYLDVAATHQASAFERVMRPQGVALPVLNMATWLVRAGEVIERIRIAIGPAGPQPMRALAAEQMLCGQRPTSDVLNAAEQALLASLRFRTSPRRASSAYRQHLAGMLLRDTVTAAYEAAT